MIKVMDMDNFYDRTKYKGKKREPCADWTLFSSYPSLTLHGHYIMGVNMNYIKVASSSLALISALLYLAYDDEPARNSSVQPE